MGTKPNPYKAVGKYKEIFLETADDATAIMAGNYGKKKTTKQNQLQKRREIQMEKIENSEISLEAYLHSIGTMTFHYDKRVTKSKPVDPVSDDEEETSENNITIIKRIVITASLDLASFMPKTSKDKVDKEPAKNISKIPVLLN